jgi:hypothetical protein
MKLPQSFIHCRFVGDESIASFIHCRFDGDVSIAVFQPLPIRW